MQVTMASMMLKLLPLTRPTTANSHPSRNCLIGDRLRTPARHKRRRAGAAREAHPGIGNPACQDNATTTTNQRSRDRRQREEKTPRCDRTHTVRTQSERVAGVCMCERWQVRRRLTCLSATGGCTRRPVGAARWARRPPLVLLLLRSSTKSLSYALGLPPACAASIVSSCKIAS